MVKLAVILVIMFVLTFKITSDNVCLDLQNCRFSILSFTLLLIVMAIFDKASI
jgi:hypothetical protein